MISFDEMEEMLEGIASELPREIYKDLNGGINLLPDTKLHPASRESEIFLLGEYVRDKFLGRYINIYHGSFVMLYDNLPPKQQREKLEGILKHEFTHHLESMAGENDLGIEDEREMQRYR